MWLDFSLMLFVCKGHKSSPNINCNESYEIRLKVKYDYISVEFNLCAVAEDISEVSQFEKCN